MARLALVALCVTATLAGARAATPLEYGMTMATTAFSSVCWYESLKIFPHTHAKQFGQCGSTAQQIQNQIENPSAQNKKYMESSEDAANGMYGKFMTDLKAMNKLPESKYYKSKCAPLLKTPMADPSADEGDALNDSVDSNYPYKAFAMCMMKALRDKHGDEAIEAVKNEKTHSLKHWMSTLLDRENEFRARHGVEPLALVEDLNEAAQKWAEKNAKECKMYHSKNKDPERQWHGDGTGESLAVSGGDDISADAAYLAADGWYEEIKDYPFPDEYQGGDDALFKKIGHFTQSVWKGSKYVGYGYAYNKKCGQKTRYIAARYSPAGNVEGQFPDNVNPPQD